MDAILLRARSRGVRAGFTDELACSAVAALEAPRNATRSRPVVGKPASLPKLVPEGPHSLASGIIVGICVPRL